MIKNPILLFAIPYLERLTNPAITEDERETISYQLDYSLLQSDGLDGLLRAYLNEDIGDLQTISHDVHLWFWDRFASRPGLVNNSDTVQELYVALPYPLVRLAIVQSMTISITEEPPSVTEFTVQMLQREEGQSSSFVVELVEILIDLEQNFTLLRVLENQPRNTSLILETLRTRRAYIRGDGAGELLATIDRQ